MTTASEQTVFVDVGHPGAYAMICGGLSVLERTIRLAGKAGATKAVVPAPPIPLRQDLAVAVEWVPEGTQAPAGAKVVRADEVAGVPIRDAASLRKAEKALVAGLGKSHEGPVDQYFNSHFSRPITTALMRTNITPNHITLFATLIGLLGAVWLLGGDWRAFAIGGTLLEIQCILDSCDGEIARLKYQGSKLGMWLDTVTDGIIDNAFVACISIAVGGVWGWIGLALVISRIYVELYVYIDVYKRTGTPDQTLFRMWYENEKATADEIYDRASFNSWFRSLGRRDVFVAAYWLFCLFNLPEGVILYASVMNGISFVGIAADHLVKTFRRKK
ncbi:MAG: CDP-alcohol phosphatidyltransferase family protein [Kofleriaceae bacterium]|nr:CDP-alcohol phosphatidyltransferase family protein [Kofleriaceae bacterium]